MEADDHAVREQLPLPARRIYDRTVRRLTQLSFLRQLRGLPGGRAGAVAEGVIARADVGAILRDLRRDRHWKREHWVLTPSQAVERVKARRFNAAAPTMRFSCNDCLRRPSFQAFALRAFLAAVVSERVRAAFSATLGGELEFRSADIARYHPGDYLRRHSDDFEQRRLGLVFFFAPGWTPKSGGQLLIEDARGRAMVVPPRAGAVALLLFEKDCYHQVASIRPGKWRRYSVACHFSARGPAMKK